MPQARIGAFLGRGNAGAVVAGPMSRLVVKWTTDPVEVGAWLAAVTHAARGQPLPGIARVFDVHLGHREAAVVREEVTPATSARWRSLEDMDGIALRRAARLIGVGRLCRHGALVQAGLDLRDRALAQGAWGPMGVGLRALAAVTPAAPSDVRAGNVAWTEQGYTLFDPGRTPLETLVAGRGEAHKRCPNATALGRAVRDLLGKTPSYADCRVVGPRDLSAVMQAHGWSKDEIEGTAGFHTQDDSILVLQGEEWSVLHELVHAAGVIDVSLAPWLAEGLTEAVAQLAAAKNRWAHHTTYADEVAMIRDRLCPALGMSVQELGRLVASDPRGAAQAIAARLAQNQGSPVDSWLKVIRQDASTHHGLVTKLRSVRYNREKKGRAPRSTMPPRWPFLDKESDAHRPPVNPLKAPPTWSR